MSTVVCGHQPNYLPYPGFFHKMMHCDQFVAVDNVEFVGRGPFGWIHRNKIRIHNKDEHWLTVPVRTAGRFHQTINEVRINNDEPWQRKHWRSIKLNYREAPYFDRYADALETIYRQEWTRLVDLNCRLLEFFRTALDIEVPFELSSRQGIDGEATGLIVNLCRAYGGDIYLSGVHGLDYLNWEVIENANIEVLIQDYDPPRYPQQYPGFVPNLSTLDLLLNCGPESRSLIREAGDFHPPEAFDEDDR